MNDVQPSELGQVFCDNLRRLRQGLGLSQSALATRINDKRKKRDPKVEAPYISDLETGKRVPYVTSLAELADALETTPDVLIAAPEKISA
jgi:transcriptional regulator with XRE-family HTH domain